MKNYAGMSNDKAADEYAYDEGQKQLREEAIDKVSFRLFKKAIIDKVMPNGQKVGEFLCGEPAFAELLNDFDWHCFGGKTNHPAWDRVHTLAYDLITAECNQAAEDEVDGN